MSLTEDECCGIAQDARSLDTYRFAVLRYLYKWDTGSNPTDDVCCGLLERSRSIDTYRAAVLNFLYSISTG